MRKTPAVLALTLLTHPAFPAQLDYWVGFTGVQSANGPTSRIRYVDVMVGSNEKPADAAVRKVETRLEASGPGGRCAASSTLKTKLNPAVTVLRFSIPYPNQAPPTAVPPVEYKLLAAVSEAQDEEVTGNNRNEFTFSFPGGGGTPSCDKLK